MQVAVEPKKAVQLVAQLDVGIMPVGNGDGLVGMVTDRDIALRGLAKGNGPNAKVRDVMTPEVKYCFIDQDIDEITINWPTSKFGAYRCLVATSVWSEFSCVTSLSATIRPSDRSL